MVKKIVDNKLIFELCLSKTVHANIEEVWRIVSTRFFLSQMMGVCINSGHINELGHSASYRRFSEWKSPCGRVFEIMDKISKVKMYQQCDFESVKVMNAPFKKIVYSFVLVDSQPEAITLRINVSYRLKNLWSFISAKQLINWQLVEMAAAIENCLQITKSENSIRRLSI